jgi:phytoene synthase
MNIYNETATATAKQLTERYSTSFSKATRLFPIAMRAHIYNIYGMVRVADEIVDTYMGENALEILDEFEQSIYTAMQRNYSANLITHAFCLTANKYGIGKQLIEPFFASMRIDCLNSYDRSQYEAYIHGSAEVVGLMCLKVFMNNDKVGYNHLAPGAKALGAAFQKVNFLRDIADDNQRLGRYYFPVGTYDSFNESDKNSIVTDIRNDFKLAFAATEQLPPGAQLPVRSATKYYMSLLNKLDKAAPAELQKRRIRVSDSRKLLLLVATLVIAKRRAITGSGSDRRMSNRTSKAKAKKSV